MTDKNEGVPIEYKKGYTRFLNCKIDLSKKVFIPRTETEFWVKKTIREIQNPTLRRTQGCPEQRRGTKSKIQKYNSKLKILDIFSGSGCIGIAVLKNIENSCVDFIDIEDKAVAQIRINLKLNKISPKRYRIFKSDLFKELALRTSSEPQSNSRVEGYNLIFANPPYVAEERIKEVQPEVLRHEPKRALLAGKGGLFFIRKFLKDAKNFLKNNGIIYLEIDPQQIEEIKKILKKYNYSEFNFYKDQFKKYRWLKIRK